MTTMAAPKRRPGRPPKPKHELSRKETVLALKGSEEFRAWLEGLAAHMRLPLSIVMEHALVVYAKQEGYDPEPPKR